MYGTGQSHGADYEQGVEDIAAHHVADGHAGIAVYGRHDADGQFRSRCAEGHDGKAYYKVRQTELAGYRRGTVSQIIGPAQYQHKAHD